MKRQTRKAALAGLASLAVLAAVNVGTAAGASSISRAPAANHYIGGLAGTTITLEGPNQWTQSGSNFGAPWAQLVSRVQEGDRYNREHRRTASRLVL